MSSRKAEARRVPVGIIGRPHGVRGLVRVQAYGETLSTRTPGDKVYLQPPAGNVRELTLESIVRHQRSWLVRFVGLTTVEAVQPLTGHELLVPEELLPELEEGEYYHYQLVGLQVETTEGNYLGVLREIIATGSNDVYVVDNDGREILIPATEQVIRLIDLDLGRMQVNLPEGLIDDL